MHLLSPRKADCARDMLQREMLKDGCWRDCTLPVCCHSRCMVNLSFYGSVKTIG